MNDRTFRHACTVAGVGNLLWADEGFGVRALERLNGRFAPPPEVRLIDGGTLGLGLLDAFTDTRDLLILDCADLRAPPGTLRVLHGNDVRPWTSTKLSAHQGGISDVLAAAALLDRLPERLAVVAVQPLELDDYGGPLSDVVRKRLDPAVDAAVRVLADWGHRFRPRSMPCGAPALTPSCLVSELYDAGRPAAEAACRTGDVRFARPYREGA